MPLSAMIISKGLALLSEMIDEIYKLNLRDASLLTAWLFQFLKDAVKVVAEAFALTVFALIEAQEVPEG